MILEKLYMSRSYSGQFTGEATFSGEVGKLALRLDSEQCKQVLAVLGEALVQTAKDTAQKLSIEVIEGVAEAKQIGGMK